MLQGIKKIQQMWQFEANEIDNLKFVEGLENKRKPSHCQSKQQIAIQFLYPKNTFICQNNVERVK